VINPQLSNLLSERVRTYGHFDSRPQVVDPLGAFVGLEQRLRRLRLKEWIGFTLIHPELYSSLVMQDAHYLASSEIYTFDRRRRGQLHEHASNAWGGSVTMPLELLGSECVYARPGYQLVYAFGPELGTHRIALDIAASRRAPAIRGELLAAIDYFQLFGRYTGTLRSVERTHMLRGVHGVCECMLARL
jgi:hypothetical protein